MDRQILAGGVGLILAAGDGLALHEPERARAGSRLDALRHILVGASLAVAVGQAIL